MSDVTKFEFSTIMIDEDGGWLDVLQHHLIVLKLKEAI
jgi:hypothetical protein